MGVASSVTGWTLRRIEKETGVRRETPAGYFRAAGLVVRPPKSWNAMGIWQDLVDLNGFTRACDFIPFALQRSVHYRRQLSRYLRARGGRVPGIYGCSANTATA